MRVKIVSHMYTRCIHTYMRELHNNQHDPKALWREMGKNFQLGKKKVGSNCSTIKSEGIVYTGLDAANIMNEYYAKMGSKLAEKFDTAWVPSPFFDILNKRKFSFSVVTIKTVVSVLRNLPINKSSGVLNLSSRLLRDGLLCMKTECTYLINSTQHPH